LGFETSPRMDCCTSFGYRLAGDPSPATNHQFTVFPIYVTCADQGFTTTNSPSTPVLTSFLTLCWFPLSHNTKSQIDQLAEFLGETIDEFLQQTSDQLQEPLPLEIVLEKQPTQFHHQDFSGWSLSIMIVAQGTTITHARRMWGLGIQALQDILDQSNFDTF